MKILQVIPHYLPSPHFGGTPVACDNLSRNLVGLGNEVDVLTTDAFDNRKRYKSKNQPEKFANYNVYRFRNLSNSLAYYNRFAIPIPIINFFLKRPKTYEIIQLNEYRSLLNVMVCLMKPFIKSKYVLYPQGTYASYNTQLGFKKIFDFLFAGIINSAIDIYIAISDAEKLSLIESGVPKDKIVTIYYGVDVLNTGYSKKIEFSYPYILYLGRIDKRKGVDLLIRAYYKSGLNKKNVHLVIAGNDNNFVAGCKKLVRTYHLQNFVHFIGPVGEERTALYKSARLVSYVTDKEAYGLVPIESALCGTESITADTAGVSEILAKYKIGYRVRYGDIAGLASLLRKLGEKKNNVPNEKIKILLKEYSWKEIASKILEVYKNV
jgi:glycosyltransferase involved in cell wall biosynthesis